MRLLLIFSFLFDNSFGRDSGTRTHIYGLKGRCHWPFRRYPHKSVLPPTNGKNIKRLRIHLYDCYSLMTLLINHFSTSFWEVLLMPAICHYSTIVPGLLTPLQKQLLDYHSTINLAGCSRLLHLYRFVSIKCTVLVTLYTPHCLPLRT